MMDNQKKMVPTLPLSLKPFSTNNIQNSAPSNHVNHITNIPLSTLPNLDLPSMDLSTFKIPEIPHSVLNDLPLPPILNKTDNKHKIALMPKLAMPPITGCPITNQQTLSPTLPLDLELPSISNLHSVALSSLPAFAAMPAISTIPAIPTMPAMPTIPLNPRLPTTLCLSPKKLSLPKMSTQFSKATNSRKQTQSSSPLQVNIDTAPQTPSTGNDRPQLSIPTPIPMEMESDGGAIKALPIKLSEVEIENKTQEILARYGISNNRKRKRGCESNNACSRPQRSKTATSRKRKYSRRQTQIDQDEFSSQDDDDDDDQESDEYLPEVYMDIHNHNNHNNKHRQNWSEEKNIDQQFDIDNIDKTTTSNTTDSNISSLPLGHPARISYKDTMSEGFTEKYRNKKRAVCHRTWARSKKCKDCKITYPSAEDYELHRMVYHSEGIQMIHECPVCASQYNERRWLNRHVRNSHFKFMCKIDGHGINHEGKANADLKKKKGKKVKPSDIDNICGFRFSSKQDLWAHQAIIHGVVNEYVQHSGKQGPTIQFMNGTDAKDIVIQRLVWNETPKKKQLRKKIKNDTEEKDEEEMDDEESVCSDDLVLDLSDITQTLKGDGLDTKDKKKNSKRKKKDKSVDKPKNKKKGKKKDKEKNKSPSSKRKKKKNKDKKKEQKSSKKKSKRKKKDKNEDHQNNHWIHSMIIATEPIVSTEPPLKKRKIDIENVA